MIARPAVELDHLTIGYRHKNADVVIARDLCESIAEGTLVCLAGPNGGGKSTLLRTIAGFLPPLDGQVRIFGKSWAAMTAREQATRIGVVLTNKGSYNNLTGEELVAIGRSPHTGFFGRLTMQDREKVDEAINMVGAAKLRKRSVVSLSDGERQKLMIAKTLAQDTPIVILDEPTAYLDYPSKVEVMRLLNRLTVEERKIIFISTHDLDIAFSTTDYIWLIDKERGFRTGTIEQLGREGVIDEYFHVGGLKFNPATKHFVIETK